MKANRLLGLLMAFFMAFAMPPPVDAQVDVDNVIITSMFLSDDFVGNDCSNTILAVPVIQSDYSLVLQNVADVALSPYLLVNQETVQADISKDITSRLKVMDPNDFGNETNHFQNWENKYWQRE
jgi:hypothetical protein